MSRNHYLDQKIIITPTPVLGVPLIPSISVTRISSVLLLLPTLEKNPVSIFLVIVLAPLSLTYNNHASTIPHVPINNCIYHRYNVIPFIPIIVIPDILSLLLISALISLTTSTVIVVPPVLLLLSTPIHIVIVVPVSIIGFVCHR